MLLSGVCPKHLFRTSDLPFYSNLKKLFYTYSTRIILVHSFPASCAAVYGAALPESEFDFKKLNLYYVQLDLDGPSGVLQTINSWLLGVWTKLGHFHTFFIFFLSCPKSCKSAKKIFFSMGGRVPPYLKVKIFWTFKGKTL